MKIRTITYLLGTAALLCLTSVVQAQTVYRIVGPDGKVTFSDKPPVTIEQGKVAGTGVGARGVAEAAGGALPFELRQTVAKFPVTLYTAPKCGPCDSGRSMLSARGVPFSERTVTTQEDFDYLQRLNGDNSLPVVSIGSKRVKGYSDSEWGDYLDAAGYPKVSALPAGFKNAGATPLVIVQKPAAPAKAEQNPEAPAVDTTHRPTPVTPSNPAGIQF